MPTARDIKPLPNHCFRKAPRSIAIYLKMQPQVVQQLQLLLFREGRKQEVGLSPQAAQGLPYCSWSPLHLQGEEQSTGQCWFHQTLLFLWVSCISHVLPSTHRSLQRPALSSSSSLTWEVRVASPAQVSHLSGHLPTTILYLQTGSVSSLHSQPWNHSWSPSKASDLLQCMNLSPRWQL